MGSFRTGWRSLMEPTVGVAQLGVWWKELRCGVSAFSVLLKVVLGEWHPHKEQAC